MAENGERRMLFDTRGRRKNVIRVVYAVLALLMGGSLFLVVGPVNIAELIGDSNTANATKVLDERVERLEGRLAADPENEQLLLELTRAQISAGNSQIELVAEGETPTVSSEAREDFEAASQSWSRYLKQADEPNPTAAQLVAGTFFRLAESSTSLLDAQENVARATKAQRIAAQERPNLGSLSTLAIYEYFNSEFDAGDRTTKRAAALTPSKAEAKSIEEQMAEYRKRGKQFAKQKQQLAKVQSEAAKEQLQNPLGGLGGQ
ncbi:MAG: hypothetical protein WDZ46_09255 [Solirubrobacterales bacterium]